MPDIHSYVGNAQAFPILRKWDFFNHAGVAPLPRVVTDALRAYADESETDSYLTGTWYKDLERLRQVSAAMINAQGDEIALVKNTSEGIGIVAHGIALGPGDRVVTTAVEYPANIYPWMQQARTRGCEVVMVGERSGPTGHRHVPLDEILEAASHPRTRVVTLSHVEFASGQRHDLVPVGEFCRGRGILFCVDAIQSMGVLPVDVRAMKIDFLSADGHKWLLGPEGAGIFYCRRELIETTEPLTVGWMNVINDQDYGNYDLTLKSDARRFECGTYNVPGFLGLKAAVELLGELGVEAVSARIRELTDHLVGRLTDKGYTVVSPRGDSQWSGIVSFVSPAHDQKQIVTTLRKQHHVEIALREGRLRCSPHFYNTQQQLDRLVELLPGH